MNPAQARQAELVKRVAAFAGHRKEIEAGEEKLIARAQEQLDSMGPAIHAASVAVEGGQGILAQRYLRELIAERAHLERVIAEHDLRKRARAADDDR